MASKKLGQHFLHNPDILWRALDALSLQPGDYVIEIGPGRGALTRALVESCKLKVDKFRIVAIEKDKKLAEAFARNFQFSIFNFQSILNDHFSNTQHTINRGDALKVLPFLDAHWKLNIENWKLVGNIPFYITGKLFRVLGELERKPETTVLMIQKEVAERVSAKPPRMNLLAASVQIWAEVEYLFSVSRKEFQPMPKVDSGVVRLKPLRNYELSESTNNDYYKFIKILFKQPRKTILNNLCDGLKRPKIEILPILRELGLDEHSRPQDLRIQLITKLSQIW